MSETPSKRKAFSFERPPVPNLKDFRQGGDARRRFVRYWTRGVPIAGLEIAFHFGLKALPAAWCSRLGAAIGRFVFPRYHKIAVARGTRTVAKLRADLSMADRQALLERNWEAQGRLITEFSIIHRVSKDPRRVTWFGRDQMYAIAQDNPVIIAGMHVANWELCAHAVKDRKREIGIFNLPPIERHKAWLAERARLKSGVTLLPPGKDSIMPALRILKRGGIVWLRVDEGFQGRIRGPFFGRPPALDSNLGLIVRLARMADVPIFPFYCLRTGDARFELHALSPIRFEKAPSTPIQAVEDAAVVNAVIEPIVMRHLDQWYFLDSDLRDDCRPTSFVG